MADRVPRVGEAPAFNAAVYSDRLQETRTSETALPPVAVFDKTKPDSINPFTQWVRGALRNTVNALTEFTADLKNDVDRNANRLNGLETRVSVLEEAPDARPFP